MWGKARPSNTNPMCFWVGYFFFHFSSMLLWFYQYFLWFQLFTVLESWSHMWTGNWIVFQKCNCTHISVHFGLPFRKCEQISTKCVQFGGFWSWKLKQSELAFWSCFVFSGSTHSLFQMPFGRPFWKSERLFNLSSIVSVGKLLRGLPVEEVPRMKLSILSKICSSYHHVVVVIICSVSYYHTEIKFVKLPT